MQKDACVIQSAYLFRLRPHPVPALPAEKPEGSSWERKRMKEQKMCVRDAGTDLSGRVYSARKEILNPLTGAPYTDAGITAMEKGAEENAEGYPFDLPEDAVPDMNGFGQAAARSQGTLIRRHGERRESLQPLTVLKLHGCLRRKI